MNSEKYLYVTYSVIHHYKWTVPQLDKLLNLKTTLSQLERAS